MHGRELGARAKLALPARYHRVMAVRVFSNNLPDPTVRAAVEEAVLGAIGAPSGDWLVQIHEKPDSPSWHITIRGPNNFQWSREFLGPEEQSALDDYAFIKRSVSEVLSRARLVVYLSYAYPDNKDGFVIQLRDRLAEELQVQTGDPVDVIWDMDRMRPGGMWSEEAKSLVKRSTVLVAVVSPSYFKSDACLKEFELFVEREPRANRPLIFPVYFVTTEPFENAASQPQHVWMQILRSRYSVDLRAHRFDLRSTKALRTVALLARSIRDAYVQFPPGEVGMVGGPKKVIEAVAPVYVESLRLKDFGCFERITLDFNRVSTLEGRWTCIAGINGSGKSTILQALGVALLGSPLALELGGERLNRMCRLEDRLNRRRSEIQLQLKEGDSDQSHQLHLFIDGGRIVAKLSESAGPPPASDWDRIRPVVIAGYGATRNLSSHVDSSSEHLSLDVRRQITLFDPLSQLAGAEVLVGRQAPNWPFVELFRKVVQQVFDTDLEVALSSPPSGIDFIVSKKDDVEAIDLPDGFRSAAAWIADLCSIWCEKAPSLAESANPSDIFGIVLIDEIDLHLHPSLQRALVPRLRTVFPKVQWIVTTHSPLVLANFDVNEIIALDRDRDGNVRELDRQILGFTSDQIYDWLMGTRPMGAEIEEELRKSDEGVGRAPEEMARLMRVSPDANGEAAQKQVSEFKEILKSLER